MANIGTLNPNNSGYIGTVRTLTLNVKVKLGPNTEKDRDNAPDFRILAGTGYEIGAAWKKVSKADKPYLSVALDDPSFPATIYARLRRRVARPDLVAQQGRLTAFGRPAGVAFLVSTSWRLNFWAGDDRCSSST